MKVDLYPRGDFNGDGIVNRTNAVPIPGALNAVGPLTDLEVLTKSGLWEDHEYRVEDLPFLIDSVDFTVSAKSFFAEHSTSEAVVSVNDSGTGLPMPYGSPVILTPAAPIHVFTVPVGRKVYVTSVPLPIGGDTNAIMRSIGDLQIPAEMRGADYAVDLSTVEMTAAVRVPEQGLREFKSLPTEKEIDTYIEALNGLEQTFGHDYAGARAWANDQGTFYTLARSGVVTNSFDIGQSNTFTAFVKWQRGFVKVKGQPFTYNVKPMMLAILGAGPFGEPMDAYAEILVEMRSAVAPDWTTSSR